MHLKGENKLNVIKWVETRDEHAFKGTEDLCS